MKHLSSCISSTLHFEERRDPFFRDLDFYFVKKTEELKRYLKECYAFDDLQEYHDYCLSNQYSEGSIFGINLIHKLYFSGKRGRVPQSLIHYYRSILNEAPPDVQTKIRSIFQNILEKFGWLDCIRSYFSSHFDRD